MKKEPAPSFMSVCCNWVAKCVIFKEYNHNLIVSLNCVIMYVINFIDVMILMVIFTQSIPTITFLI